MWGGEARAEWPLAPRWTAGQELVYRGTVREVSTGRGVQFSKTFRLEARTLVTEVGASGQAQVAFYTRLLPQQPGGGTSAETASVRLEMATVDGLGRLTPAGGPGPDRAGDGPATWEAGFFAEVPGPTVAGGQVWQVNEAGRPPRRFEVMGAQNFGGTSCVKVKITQQSEDWDKPRADSTAWRCEETLWIVPRLGLAQRVERVVERRAPAHQQATSKLFTEYDLDSNLRYDGLFLEDRKRDINQARQYQQQIDALVPDAAKVGTKPFEAILTRIDQYAQQHPATPYREAVLRARAMAVAGTMNRLRPQVVQASHREVLVIGQPAPEFVIRDLEGKQTVTLRSWKGRPVLLAFYLPHSEATPGILRHLQQLRGRHKDQDVGIIGMPVTDDAAAVARLTADLSLTYPMLAGRSLRRSYGAEATPHFVLLDADGVVWAVHTGWGPETPAALEGDLRRLAEPGRGASPPPE
jgi:peroxiredoxin